MTRKEWLKVFLHLADANAPCREYRRLLRIRAQDIPANVKLIPLYREELALLDKQETDQVAKKQAAKRAKVEEKEKADAEKAGVDAEKAPERPSGKVNIEGNRNSMGPSGTSTS